MYKKTEEIRNLYRGLQTNAFASVNLFSPDATLTDAVAADVTAEAGDAVISIRVASYNNFSLMIRDILTALLIRDDKPDGCRVPDEAIEEGDMNLLRRHTGRLLNSFSRNNCWFCLLLTEFDAAADYWEEADFAWMRELVDSGKIPACVVLSSQPLACVSEKPAGSSPFYNIFRQYALQEDV